MHVIGVNESKYYESAFLGTGYLDFEEGEMSMDVDIQQLEFIDKKIREILSWLKEETGLGFTATSLYRINNGGVHGQLPLRGVDLRCLNTVIGFQLESMINEVWHYDNERPHMRCAIFHKGDSGEWHLHIQVHPNTVKVV